MQQEEHPSFVGLWLASFLRHIDAVYAHAERLQSLNPRRAALLHQSALAKQMLVELGLRPALLATIDVHTDLVRDGSGCIEAISLADPRGSKGGHHQWPLSDRVNERLQHHLHIHWPHLASNGSSRLFPGGVHIDGAHQIRKAIVTMLQASGSLPVHKERTQ